MKIAARPLLLGAAAALAAILCLVVAAIVALQHGAGDGLVRSGLSAKLHRPVSFAHAKLHLVSSDPTVVLNDVRVTSPPEITRDDLLLAKAVTLHLGPGSLMLGQVELKAIAIEGATLNLVRLGHARNNYTFGKGGSGKLLGGVTSLRVSDSRWRMDDPDRHIHVGGSLRHEGDPRIALPLMMQGTGSISEQPVSLSLRGAALNGRKPSAPWPIDVEVMDGAATLHLAGSTQAPFDFRGYDLRAESEGPNLAVLGALLRTQAPNSAPYALQARVGRQAHVVTVTDLVGRVGASDVRGEITSDHNQPRRRITAALHFGNLTAADVAILLSHPAPHAAARSQPGKTSLGSGADKPFSAATLRKQDAALQINARSVTGYALPLHDLALKLQLDTGKLSIPSASAHLPSGFLAGDAVLDARRDTASGVLHARLSGARLSALRPKLKSVVDGDLNATVSLAGAGASPRAMLADAHGEAAFRLLNGRLQPAPAAVLGGDPLSVVPLAFGKGGGMQPLRCAQGSFTARRGVFTADSLAIATASGVAHGTGTVDLAGGRLNLHLQGAPARRFAVAAPPATIVGPLAHPKVSIDKGGLVARGLAGAALAVVTAPLQMTQTATAASSPGCG